MPSQQEERKTILVTWRRAIIASILAGLIILYFLDPILSFLGRLTLRIAGALFSAYLDGLYAGVAISEPNFGFYLLLCATGFSLGITSGFILQGLGVIEKRISSTLLPERVRRVAILSAIISILLLVATVDSYIRLKTISTFNQRLSVITPLITDQQRKEFLARFASMESKADFEAVMRTMDEVAVKNNVKVPKNRLYPF
jgi:hypothetical protein